MRATLSFLRYFMPLAEKAHSVWVGGEHSRQPGLLRVPRETRRCRTGNA
jgi:hypothetical protein